MKINSTQPYRYSARVWAFEEDTENSQGGIVYYETTLDFRFELTTDPNAPRQVILSKTPLKKEMKFDQVRDSYGNLVMGDATYIVTRLEPIMNVLGTHELYRMQAALNVEPTYEGLIDLNTGLPIGVPPKVLDREENAPDPDEETG